MYLLPTQESTGSKTTIKCWQNMVAILRSLLKVIWNLWVRSQSHKQSSLCWCKSKKRGSLWIRSLHVVVLVSYYIIVKTDCKNNSLIVDLFTMRIAMWNPLQVFILKRFISPVFLGHHIVCYLLFRIFAWYDLLLFNLDLNN